MNALNEYLELMGAHSIHNLPLGSGKPPSDDPQIYPESPSIHYPYKLAVRMFSVGRMSLYSQLVALDVSMTASRLSLSFIWRQIAPPCRLLMNRRDTVAFGANSGHPYHYRGRHGQCCVNKSLLSLIASTSAATESDPAGNERPRMSWRAPLSLSDCAASKSNPQDA